MGKGDRKTARGKRTIGSYGVSRKRKKSVKFVAKPKKKKAPAKNKPNHQIFCSIKPRLKIIGSMAPRR